MKLACTFLLLAVCSGHCFAQEGGAGGEAAGGTNCRVGLADAPALQGFKLGDELADVKRRYPKFKYLRDGVTGAESAYIYRYTRHVYGHSFDSLDSGLLHFIDGRLTSIELYYSKPRWASIGEFTARVSETLRLPDSWTGDAKRSLACEGFSLEASLPVPAISRLTLRASGLEGVIERRRLEAEQRKQTRITP